MAARNLASIRALDRDAVVLFGGGTGAGAADMTTILGAGVTSVTRTGSGLYTVTLQDKWNKLLWFDGIIIDTTTQDDWEVVIVSESVASAKTISISIFKGGAAADLSTDEKLKFIVFLSNTAQPPTAR